MRIVFMSPSERVPTVSVVVPCYNGGRFIDQLLATLGAQTFQDFELVIVDDGSDAETRARLARLDPAIRVIHQDNQGPGAARNTGFAAARAALIFAMDCDDTIAPDTLERMAALLVPAPPEVAVVCCHARLGNTGRLLPGGFDPFALLFTNTVTVGFMIRKAAWERVGGYDASMRDGYEDWEFNLRVAHAGYRGLVIPEPLVTYRISETGMLFGTSALKHAAIGRYIRRKHRDLYRLSAILKLWWRTRGKPRRVPLWRAMAMLGFAEVTPDALQTRVVIGRRQRRFFGPGTAR
jgi:glycosyltransferase involved in cell wall biosynthesis